MNSSAVLPAGQEAFASARPSLVCRIARRGLLRKFAGFRHGVLELVDGATVHRFGAPFPSFPHPIRLQVNHPNFYGDLALGGSIGAGESYMCGAWDCDDLTGLMRLVIENRGVLDALDSGSAWLTHPLHALFHRMHQNTVEGSRRNILAHYDLGNDFFRLFLDETMMYSCGFFATPDTPLREASEAKLDMVCRKLALTPEDHVLEIGTGWGGFAIHAAGRYGCRVTTTTISDAQHELAAQRIREAGLGERITLLKRDFRTLEGSFDKVVSIEMIEAVGEKNIGAFFEVCNRCLKPGGSMLLQAITIRESLFPSYRKSVDFIQRFIFPGGFLPSVTFMTDQIGRRTQLRVEHLQDMASHYVTTLRHWRSRFVQNRAAIAALGYSNAIMRLWEFYFSYCEAGFESRQTGVVQMLLQKDPAPAPLG